MLDKVAPFSFGRRSQPTRSFAAKRTFYVCGRLVQGIHRLSQLGWRLIRSREKRALWQMASHPFTVANRFLELAAAKGKTLTPLQLIKLVYIAHGWSLALLNRRLVNEQPEAWQYGPVIPSIYHEVKKFRDGAIIGRLTSIFAINDNLTPEANAVISRVYDSYGHFSGGQLSSLTHQPGTPWSIIWNEFGRNSQIPDKIIKEHFDRLK